MDECKLCQSEVHGETEVCPDLAKCPNNSGGDEEQALFDDRLVLIEVFGGVATVQYVSLGADPLVVVHDLDAETCEWHTHDS